MVKSILLFVLFAGLSIYSIPAQVLVREVGDLVAGHEYGINATPVNQSEKLKTCPTGYQMLGKQCARTVTSEPQITCPNGGTLQSDTQCVTYLGKTSECDAGFVRSGGVCERSRTAPRQTVCPDGYLLRNDGLTCVHPVPLPDHEACPPGAEPHGDLCVIYGTVAPVMVCPEGFIMEGNRCEIDELYDCTPDRPDLEGAAPGRSGLKGFRRRLAGLSDYNGAYPINQPVTYSSGQTAAYTSGRSANNLVAYNTALVGSTVATSGRNAYIPAGVVNVPAIGTPATYTTIGTTTELTGRSVLQPSLYATPAPPIIGDVQGFTEDYVVRSTCKRIRVESARKVCPQGVSDGKVCRTEAQVRSILVPGGVVEEIVPSEAVCPAGYSPSGAIDACTVTEETIPQFFCEAGTRDLGDRCALYTPSRITCDPGFALEGDICVQTQFTPPSVEYTVTYNCVGKEC